MHYFKWQQGCLHNTLSNSRVIPHNLIGFLKSCGLHDDDPKGAGIRGKRTIDEDDNLFLCQPGQVIGMPGDNLLFIGAMSFGRVGRMRYAKVGIVISILPES